jgi:hypothetical protein
MFFNSGGGHDAQPKNASVLRSSIFAGRACADPITGEAWIAQHDKDGVATDDDHLISNAADITNVNGYGFAFLDPGDALASALTGQAGNAGLRGLHIDHPHTAAERAARKLEALFPWPKGLLPSMRRLSGQSYPNRTLFSIVCLSTFSARIPTEKAARVNQLLQPRSARGYPPASFPNRACPAASRSPPTPSR